MATTYQGMKVWDMLAIDHRHPAFVVRYGEDIGIAFCLNQPLSPSYGPEDVIIFWRGGETTTISDDVEIVDGDLWAILQDREEAHARQQQGEAKPDA